MLSANEQVAWIAKLQLTVYMMQLNYNFIKTTHFQTTMQLHYNCTHDVIDYHPSVKI
jgi:hypothetical protein